MAEVQLDRSFHEIWMATEGAIRDILEGAVAAEAEASDPSFTSEPLSIPLPVPLPRPDSAPLSSSSESESKISQPPFSTSMNREDILTPATSLAPSAEGSPSLSNSSLAALSHNIFAKDADGKLARCPIDFAAIRVGIAGCDSPRDVERMSSRLSAYL